MLGVRLDVRGTALNMLGVRLYVRGTALSAGDTNVVDENRTVREEAAEGRLS